MLKKENKRKEVVLMTKAFLLVSFTLLTLIGCATTRTVEFSSLGATNPVQRQRVAAETEIILPDGEGLSFGDAVFSGWVRFVDGQVVQHNPGESYIVPAHDSYFMAHWKIEARSLREVNGLVNQLIWLMNNAESNSSHIIEVQNDETIPNFPIFSYNNKENIKITLRGTGANRTIKQPTADKGSVVFSIYNGISLVLENITIDNSVKLGGVVWVQGGNLTMNSGSTITGTEAANGVRLDSGTFVMNSGATITGIRGMIVTSNKGGSHRTYGNGVQLFGGTFTMNQGATISNCNESGVALGTTAAYQRSQTSTFIMNGGTISGNGGNVTKEKDLLQQAFSGGGVSVNNGTFTMNGGSITNNGVAGNGGGVIVGTGGATLIVSRVTPPAVFTMTGGEITRNSASGFGGGLFVSEGATFNMSGGSITNNNSQGGGFNNVAFFENPQTGAKAIVNITGGNIQSN